MKNVVRSALCLALLLLAGCTGGAGPKTTEVSGKVTMDGAPLETGDVLFESLDQGVSPSSAPIVNGEYKAKVQPGKKTVRITSSRPGAPDPVMGTGPPQQIVAKEFNAKSTLSHTVEATEQKDVNFEVKAMK
ncbi:hypothetical protein NA78x_002915 [Anatilimnocola sp. NA78]|uniref:hypothetical protein n=1 Tax=Anatilimnocola sp. NA78 TaxID=3415683 RepID=UPI003CE51B71